MSDTVVLYFSSLFSITFLLKDLLVVKKKNYSTRQQRHNKLRRPFKIYIWALYMYLFYYSEQFHNSKRFSHNNKNNYAPRYLEEVCKSTDQAICYPEGLHEVEVNWATHYMNLLQIRF